MGMQQFILLFAQGAPSVVGLGVISAAAATTPGYSTDFAFDLVGLAFPISALLQCFAGLMGASYAPISGFVGAGLLGVAGLLRVIFNKKFLVDKPVVKGPLPSEVTREGLLKPISSDIEPQRVPSAWFLFVSDYKPEYPDLSADEALGKLYVVWTNLDVVVKQKYESLHAELESDYQKKYRSYQKFVQEFKQPVQGYGPGPSFSGF